MSINGLALAFLNAVQTAYGVVITDSRFYIASQTLVPTGVVQAYAGSSAPSGWLICDGSAVSRTTYANLFALIQSTYGSGDGTTTFNLPNLQASFIRGAGTQTVGGISYTATLGATQGDTMQGHFHALSQPQLVSYSGGGGSAGASGLGTNPSVTVQAPSNDSVNGAPRTGTETRPLNVALTYIIAT